MGKTRPEITQQKAAWEKEWSSIATPKMMEALALLAALPDPQFTLVLERCLDRLRVIDRRLEAELEAGPAPSRCPRAPKAGRSPKAGVLALGPLWAVFGPKSGESGGVLGGETCGTWHNASIHKSESPMGTNPRGFQNNQPGWDRAVTGIMETLAYLTSPRCSSPTPRPMMGGGGGCSSSHYPVSNVSPAKCAGMACANFTATRSYPPARTRPASGGVRFVCPRRRIHGGPETSHLPL